MGRRTTSTLLFSALLLLLMQSVSSKNPPSIARKEDLPFIRCQVCRKIAEELHGLVQKKQTQISPKMISELQIIDIAENVCNLKKEESDWILRIDIVEKGDTLELVDQGTEGQCNSECKTIERACQEVMGYSDTDVAEYIFKARPSINALVNYLCGDLTKACSVKAPPIPKDRIPGEPFVAKSSKEAEMEKILKSMQGKVLRQKETAKPEWKGRILEGVKQSGAAIKKHVDRSLYRIQKWWGGKKTGGKASKAVLVTALASVVYTLIAV
ncbi:hypothetical protein QJS04_geneDACA002551 [Acorus gramineus]|uniref:Saposin B-type domain-containing protein n=1 Tax=Acorus gramineus TaxID=55184 RepID=A0AAV9AT92_ACOGR|nr:hypothetical protein QJS04_geneDACA002551 [Acorus gramineus]